MNAAARLAALYFQGQRASARTISTRTLNRRLTPEQAAADLDLTSARFQAVLDVDGAQDPADVWLLRDYFERAVQDVGGRPVAFTVLTEGARVRARRWCALREAPRHRFQTS